jgi:hypothetical protein
MIKHFNTGHAIVVLAIFSCARSFLYGVAFLSQQHSGGLRPHFKAVASFHVFGLVGKDTVAERPPIFGSYANYVALPRSTFVMAARPASQAAVSPAPRRGGRTARTGCRHYRLQASAGEHAGRPQRSTPSRRSAPSRHKRISARVRYFHTAPAQRNTKESTLHGVVFKKSLPGPGPTPTRSGAVPL